MLAIEPQAIDFSYLYTGTVPNDRTEDGIAIVHINGPLEHHATAFWDSYEAILCRVENAMTGADFDTSLDGDGEGLGAGPARAVVLCIDSPGGEAAGATDCHRQLRKLRKKYNIPLYAYANEMAASAAYEIACACDEVWLPDTGMVGSIGVIATLFDRTQQNEKQGLNVVLVTSGEQKADNHADRVIDDAIRTRMQGRVDSLANVFWSVVAKSRGVSVEAVAALEAGVFVGTDAIKAGIADGVAGYSKFIRLVSEAINQDVGEQPNN